MPRIIDLAFAGVEPDGSRVYAPPAEALALWCGRGLGWLIVNRPRETLHGLALVLVAGICIFLVRDATNSRGYPEGMMWALRRFFAL
jgi:hypothetical protein